MPAYKADKNHIVTEGEAQACLNVTADPQKRAVIAALYITGARPCELARLAPKDVDAASDGGIKASLWNAKLRTKRFRVEYRTLDLAPETPFLPEFKEWLEARASAPLAPLFKGVDWTWKAVRDASIKSGLPRLCPYVFRHSRLTKLARGGASIDELMAWKGASDVKSVGAYLRGKIIDRRLKVV